MYHYTKISKCQWKRFCIFLNKFWYQNSLLLFIASLQFGNDATDGAMKIDFVGIAVTHIQMIYVTFCLKICQTIRICSNVFYI